jgi:hypothetical protein
MDVIESRLRERGLALPGPVVVAATVRLPFAFVRVRGNRALVSGHGPQNPDGTIAPPLGKLGRELGVEQGYYAARLTALSILGSLKRELGELDGRNRGLVLAKIDAAQGAGRRSVNHLAGR